MLTCVARAGIERDETALPCDLHVIVDATTGAVIEGFQGGCAVVPNDGDAQPE